MELDQYDLAVTGSAPRSASTRIISALTRTWAWRCRRFGGTTRRWRPNRAALALNPDDAATHANWGRRPAQLGRDRRACGRCRRGASRLRSLEEEREILTRRLAAASGLTDAAVSWGAHAPRPGGLARDFVSRPRRHRRHPRAGLRGLVRLQRFLVALLREFGWRRSVLAGAFSIFTLVSGGAGPGWAPSPIASAAAGSSSSGRAAGRLASWQTVWSRAPGNLYLVLRPAHRRRGGHRG